MFCCALSYTTSEESFLIKEASVVGLCHRSIQSGVILVHDVYFHVSTQVERLMLPSMLVVAL